MSNVDPEALVPRTQNLFRVDQVAELFEVSVKHIIDLVTEGEIFVPKKRIRSASSGASILIQRRSLVAFVRRRQNTPERLKANERRRLQQKKKGRS
jgi:hypothetical protein